MEYTILLEKGINNWSAYCPDLPGCVSTGRTKEETINNMKKAIEFHIEGIKKDGDNVPEPSTIATIISI
ncbi:MAG: type II toxin-antitoxin system HicB family antitoxin [Spirochaetota bacterium]|nr:type II toxin-antitoxin system HicB family antitoxin [Spirochaetota bacterium]